MAEIIHFGGDEGKEDDLKEVEEAIGSELEARSPELENPTSTLAALNLRLSGASYQEIADVMGYVSAATARMAVEKALAAAATEDGDKKTLRSQMSLTLDKYHQSVYRQAIDEDNPNQLAYQAAALRIVDRKIKLHGLDAPAKLEIMPSTEELENFARQLASRGGYAPVVEGDPFTEVEMEEGPDGEWHPKEASDAE